MIKSKLSITQISLIFTSLLSVALIIVSSVYSHQLSVLKRGYQIQSETLQICQKNIVYQQDCPKQDCSVCSNSTKSSNIFLLKGTYNNQIYQKVIKFEIASSYNTGYTIKEVCTEEQDQECQYLPPDNIIILNTDGELELTTGDTVAKLSSDASTTGESPTWTKSSWGMPWSKNAIKVKLPVYASESDVLLQKDIQKIKSSSSVAQIEAGEIGTITSSSASNINVDTITQIISNVISNITINDGSVTKKETVLDGIRQLSSSENGITYISSPKISDISSKTIETINTDYAVSIKLISVGTDTTKTAIDIENGVNGQIKIGGSISCDSKTEACVNLKNINNANSSYALSVSGNVKSPVIFSKDSNISATFTNEGTFSDVVNTGTFNSVQNTGTITNGITNNKGTIGDITNQAESNLGSVSNTGTMSSFTNSGTLTGSIIINKGTANGMKNEAGNLTNGLQINGGTIGSTSTTSGLSINGDTTIQGSDVGILIGSDGSKDDIKIQTSGGTYGILMQQATIGHIEIYRGINIDNRGDYHKNNPWVNIFSSSDVDSYAIFVGPNNVKLHSPTSDKSDDTHTYYYMQPKIHGGYWNAVTQGRHYECTAIRTDD